jgi:hypothetical protein
LIVLGHIASEEPGSEHMSDWLHKKIAGMQVTDVPAGEFIILFVNAVT